MNFSTEFIHWILHKNFKKKFLATEIFCNGQSVHKGTNLKKTVAKRFFEKAEWMKTILDVESDVLRTLGTREGSGG